MPTNKIYKPIIINYNILKKGGEKYNKIYKG